MYNILNRYNYEIGMTININWEISQTPGLIIYVRIWTDKDRV